MSADTWEATLDRFQRDLDDLDETLATGADVVSAPWTPPVHIGPLPAVLRPRAEELLERMRAARAQVQATQAELTSKRQDVDRRRQANAAYHGVPRGTDRHRTA